MRAGWGAKMNRMALLVLAASLLGGCADDVYYKEGATQADFQRDSYECERDARMSAASFGGGIAGAMEARNFYRRCMGVRGYRLGK